MLGIRSNTALQVIASEPPTAGVHRVALLEHATRRSQHLRHDQALLFDSSTGKLTATSIVGDGSAVSNVTASIFNGDIPNSQLVYDGVTVGSTEVKLGGSLSSLAGLISVESALVYCTTLGCTTVNCTTVNAVAVNGDGAGLSSITAEFFNGTVPNTQLAYDTVTIGTTEVALGGFTTTLTGLSAVTSTTVNTSTINGTSGVLGIGGSNLSGVGSIDASGVILVRGHPTDTNRAIRLQSSGQDGASYTAVNGSLSSWHGVGLHCLLDNKNRHVFDTRTGSTSMTGACLASGFYGSAVGLTSVPVDQFSATIENDKLSNNTIRIGNATCALGGSIDTIIGLLELNVGSLSSAAIYGPGIGLTSIPVNQFSSTIENETLSNSSITIGSTGINLGAAVLSIDGLEELICDEIIINTVIAPAIKFAILNYENPDGYIERMRMTTTGLGIGIETPQTDLHLVSPTNTTIRLGSSTTSEWSIEARSTTRAGNFEIRDTLTNADRIPFTIHPDAPNNALYINSIGLSINTTNSITGYDLNVHSKMYVGEEVKIGADIASFAANSSFVGSTLFGVNKQTPTKPLDVLGSGFYAGVNVDVGVNHYTGSANGASFNTFRYNGAQIGDIAQATTSSVVFNTTSDYRLKENVIEMPSMLQRVSELRPVQFRYLNDDNDSLGFIAHEFQKTFPNSAIVSGTKDAEAMTCSDCYETHDRCQCKGHTCAMKPVHQSMDYGKITPILTKAVQELSQIVIDLSARLAALEK
jgi:hypothetical protein